MLVGKLFRELFARNIMIITSSNRKPDDLYLNGLQRDSFLEFITLIKDQLEIFELKSGKDYRLEKITAFKKTFFTPLGKDANNFIKQSFSNLANGNNPISCKITVNQRDIICNNTYKDLALFDFSELFQVPLGSADYIALCENFNIIILSNIPILSLAERNEARRFIEFIDILYERKTILICTSEGEPQSIYSSGDGKFEFERTISRLIEMQSEDYIKRRLC
jgi:cell division protein ZapE